ncbi:MAG: restriction endonuclease subunit S [Planctomycetes bacterium]|nr:restriction endonuclease subunit S [Planctomycetota bacterium]
MSVPDHWRWIRLGNLASKIGSGSTPRGGSKVYVNDGIPFLRSQNIWNDGVRLDDVVFISAETHGKMRNTHVKPNDILLNITGASLGRCAIAPVDFPAANVSQHVTIIRPLLTETRHFLHICLLAPLGQGMIWGRQVGMAREGLSKKVLEQFEIPLPPLEEQKRIVTKVDELMRLCDRLEAQQQEREKLLPLLSRANHARFVAKPTVSHLEPLFQRPRLSSTEDLRNTVLTLGVTGRLTQRLPGDDSAMTLLKEMQEQQTLLHQAIVGRNRTAVSNAVLPEWASKLPDSWETPHFDDVLVITSGITKGRNLAGRRTVRLPYLRVANVQRWQLSLEQMKEIEILEEERERYRLLRGDIVMIEGGDWDKLGRAAIWNEEIKDCVFQNHIFRVRSPDKTKLLPEWVMLFANSPLGREYFESCSKQTTNLASINMTQLRACRLPLPSTAEQKRIVDKVKYLLELVDRLDGKKSVAADTAQLFATAAVAAITSTEFTENERMKPPIIEVVTALKVGKKPKTRDVAPLATILLQTGGEASAKELWKQSDLLEIDAFYRQLKTEMAKGWITEPEKAFVKEVEVQ